MLDNIHRPEPETIERYVLSYEWNDTPGAGYGFPCTKDGERIVEEGNDAAEQSWIYVQNNLDKLTFMGIEDYSTTYRPPAQGTCKCGRTVYLERDYGHGIDCDCGRIYNGSGQELAPRSQWEDRYNEDSTQPYNVEFGYVREDY